MDLKYKSVVIFVRDIEISKRFYGELLEQTIKFDFGKNVMFETGISLWEPPNNHLITKNLKIRTSSNPIELYFESEAFEQLYNRIKSKEVNFFHDVIEESWGQRTIRFFDPDNHLIEIGESMKSFILRMKNEGMTPLEISQKTSIPVEEIPQIINEK